jgi:hypothetical protein
VIAPSDSRFRGDQRLFEDGKWVEADEEKLRLEVKQRAARKKHTDDGTQHTFQFFDSYDTSNPFTK